MSSFFASAVVCAVALIAAGAPAAGDESYCNSGPVQRCNSVQSAQQASTAVLTLVLSATSMGPNQITGQIGLTCSPIGIMGSTGANSCSSQTVCCENNSFNGVVALGCTPVNISL
ncbi:hypothetical protein AMATHDRAFT_51622 [Amanita thiersii Skay4041]|uniref:Hydrophobin n=1 Tax=Amanita thiersii Skay4041 TaxID=703135 RepID=A0A2A9N6T9_9AGAR|nr:hypothetical protein AMATHDRAFT_51622 [Amanita thiersii Skay4041]